MPALPNASHVLRVRLFFTIGGKPTQGVRFFLFWSGTTPTAAALNALALAIVNRWFTVTLPGVMHPDNVFTSVAIEDLTTPTGATGFSGVTGGQGTRTGGPLPAEVAFVSSYEIVRRYRGGHGRSYWPFGTDTDVTTPQAWTTAAVSVFITRINALFSGIIGTTYSGTTITGQVVVGYYEGFTVITSPTTGRARNVPTLRTTPLVQTVTGRTGRTRIGSFRRRRIAA